jgi:hypothetical protein
MKTNELLDLLDLVKTVSLETAGLEEESLTDEIEAVSETVFRNGIYAYLDWFYDGSIENDDY